MGANRKERLRAIQTILGSDKLIWFGTRGTDSHALLQLPQFTELYSIVAPLGALSLRNEVCLETLKGVRVDLDRYGIDHDDSPEAKTLISRLYHSLDECAWVAMYRPNPFFAALYFPHCGSVRYLGQFHERQAPFEHKPWVESELSRCDVPVVPWRYFGDGEEAVLQECLREGPMVLRSSRSDGGAGLSLVRDPSESLARRPAHSDHFLGIAPFMWPNVPLNINGVVFRNGSVSLHAPSLQLIGIPDFTNRTFGYCGNDFARVRDLPPTALDQLQEIAEKSAAWLARQGYVGAFGVDAMLYQGQVYLAEINPRFQGSSHLASVLDGELGRSDMFLEHLAACLDLEPPPRVSLRELAREQRAVAQVVCHNVKPTTMRRNDADPEFHPNFTCALLPQEGIIVEQEAILFRAVCDEAVTKDGLNIEAPWSRLLNHEIDCLFDPVGDALKGETQ